MQPQLSVCHKETKYIFISKESRALNVEMLKFLFAVLMVLFFWKVYKTFLAMRAYGHRETGIPSENFDESCLVKQREDEKGELSSQGKDEND